MPIHSFITTGLHGQSNGSILTFDANTMHAGLLYALPEFEPIATLVLTLVAERHF